jgi:penicillin-binding protein 1B
VIYGSAGAAAVGVVVLGVLWFSYARMIDARFGGDERPVPRVFARPFELTVGRGLSPTQLIQRLNDVRYTQKASADRPGEFVAGDDTVTMHVRAAGSAKPRIVKVDFRKGNSPTITRMTEGGKAVKTLALEPALVASLAPGERKRYVPLNSIPERMVQAVVAIEDRRFFDHPGVDIIGSVGALITNLRGTKEYLVGGSTVTQQIVKNTFLTPEKTMRRKLQEQFMAIVLETRLSKEQILELYLNEVVLGQRGPFEIRGVAEAARIFFGKDISNVTLGEAATIAGVIQSPSRLSPFRNPERAQERRDVVLEEMVEVGYVRAEDAARAKAEPLKVAARALENEAPYFVDYVSQVLEDQVKMPIEKSGAVDIYTTLDLHMQRIAQEAVSEGLAQVDKQLAARRRPPKGQPQAALVAVDPRTGEILAMVGGRSYSQSQYNRAVAARRQPGSTFKPFVYLAAFEQMAAEGRSEITPASVVMDEPTVFRDGENDYSPGNYQNEYDGPVTLRQALARSRNVVAIKVAEIVGYDRVADLWKKTGVGTPARPFPSIALGVFEATPVEMATAYTLFMNNGSVRPLRAIDRLVEQGKSRELPPAATRSVARPDTTYLVTSMMRSVMNEGTGAGARAQFSLDAAGKSGTTNDLRDAWFVGFTPELLTIVWVGFDDNQPIGLGGSQAALPIWTSFMRRALAARASIPFSMPNGIVTAEIDRDTGLLATADCPRRFTEVFLAGTEPAFYCHIHGGNSVSRFFGRIGRAFGRIIR